MPASERRDERRRLGVRQDGDAPADLVNYRHFASGTHPTLADAPIQADLSRVLAFAVYVNADQMAGEEQEQIGYTQGVQLCGHGHAKTTRTIPVIALERAP